MIPNNKELDISRGQRTTLKQAIAAAYCTIAIGCTPSEDTAKPPERVETTSLRTTLPDWVSVQAQLVRLHRSIGLSQAKVLVHEVPLESIGWSADPGASVWMLDFSRGDSAIPAVSYALCNWQRMHWKGPATTDNPKRWKVHAVNKYSLVLGPMLGADQSIEGQALTAKSAQLMEHVFSIEATRKTSQLESISADKSSTGSPKSMGPSKLAFMPYHLRYSITSTSTEERPTTINAGQWSSVVSRRMLELVRTTPTKNGIAQTLEVQLYPPAEINRTRPLQSGIKTQSPYPSAGQRRDQAIFERKLARHYRESLHNVVQLGLKTSRRDRLTIYEQALPPLNKLFKTYAKATGLPAKSNKKQLDLERKRLQALLMKGEWDSLDHQVATTPLSYRPSLAEQILAIPAPTRVDLARLSRAFKKYRDLASAKSSGTPSDAQIVLAEIGDRIRTVTALTPRAIVRNFFTIIMPGVKELSYPAFSFSQREPLGDKTKLAPAMVQVEIDIR